LILLSVPFAILNSAGLNNLGAYPISIRGKSIPLPLPELYRLFMLMFDVLGAGYLLKWFAICYSGI
jgi:hypothetical protein